MSDFIYPKTFYPRVNELAQDLIQINSLYDLKEAFGNLKKLHDDIADAYTESVNHLKETPRRAGWLGEYVNVRYPDLMELLDNMEQMLKDYQG